MRAPRLDLILPLLAVAAWLLLFFMPVSARGEARGEPAGSPEMAKSVQDSQRTSVAAGQVARDAAALQLMLHRLALGH